jgi:murein L,D-transpeptidase YafK
MRMRSRLPQPSAATGFHPIIEAAPTGKSAMRRVGGSDILCFLRNGALAVGVMLAVGGGTYSIKSRWLSGKPSVVSATVNHSPSGDLLPINDAPAAVPASLPDSPDRVAAARIRRTEALREKFAAAGLAYPPREIFLRAFKQEGQLELWARASSGAGPAAPLRLVTAYPILRGSGRLGPKRREGDGQIPEGFYLIDRFNPRSLFHLSLGLDYPNASDRLLAADPEHPGSDIFIHGGAVSVGCMAMGDAAAEEIYLTAWEARAAGQAEIPVHVFPCRMDAAHWQTLLTPRSAGQPELAAFWRNLQPGFDRFEQMRRAPRVSVGPDGRYAFDDP